MAQKYNLDYVRQQQQRMIRDGVLGPDSSAESPGTPAPPVSTPAVQPTVAPGPGTPPPPAYGGGADYNAPGGLQQQFWNTLGVTGGAGTIAPGMLQGKAADLQKLGIGVVSPDKIRLPDGTIVDVAGDFNPQTGGAAVWQDPRYSATGGDPGSPGGGAPAAPGAGGGAVSSPGGGGFQDQIRALLLEQLGKMGEDPAIDDPALKNQSDAFRRAQVRGGEQQRAALAERAAFTGLNSGGAGSGAFETGIQGIQEGIGEDTAAFDAGLVGQELQGRRAQLQNLLQMALATGDAEAARMVQLQMAQMDDALRRATLGQQRYQYDDTMGFNVGRAAEDDLRYRTNLGVGG